VVDFSRLTATLREHVRLLVQGRRTDVRRRDEPVPLGGS
jgi:hypothetical protein